MFLIILGVVLVGAAAHVALRGGDRSRERVGELVLRWVLAGYCGVPMVVVAGLILIHPHEMMEMLGFPPDNPIAVFFGWAYLGMAVAATLSLRYRGPYLVGPALTWAVFFSGATFIHLAEGHGAGTHVGMLFIVATHGLISVILVGALVASGAWRRPLSGSPVSGS